MSEEPKWSKFNELWKEGTLALDWDEFQKALREELYQGPAYLRGHFGALGPGGMFDPSFYAFLYGKIEGIRIVYGTADDQRPIEYANDILGFRIFSGKGFTYSTRSRSEVKSSELILYDTWGISNFLSESGLILSASRPHFNVTLYNPWERRYGVWFYVDKPWRGPFWLEVHNPSDDVTVSVYEIDLHFKGKIELVYGTGPGESSPSWHSPPLVIEVV